MSKHVSHRPPQDFFLKNLFTFRQNMISYTYNKEGEHMSKLQQHYYNFQSLPTVPEKILYLQKHSKDLYQYNINVRNLIRAWSTNDWPHLRPKQEHAGF